jgi:hypothetical protein
MTDGEENASKRFKLDDVTKMIKHQTDVFGWQFYFFGATEKAMLEGERLGIPNLIGHASSSDGFKLAYQEMSQITTQFRIEYNKEGGDTDAIEL